MWFWWFLFCFDILIPIVMIIAGWFMKERPPKDINGFVGYRTTRSMKNRDTWVFAHEYCGRIWFKSGCILLILSILVHIPYYHATSDKIGQLSVILSIIQVSILTLAILPTEIALRRTFTKDGIRK